MFNFSTILAGLHAVIAAKAARDQTLVALVVALCGRLARMGTRHERLIARWRAGTLPPPRAARPGEARAGEARAEAQAERAVSIIRFPSAAGWLRLKLGYEVSVYGGYLQQQLTEAECAAFLAACPQAGRILRPLLRMLTADPVPEIIRVVKRAVVSVAGPLFGPFSGPFSGPLPGPTGVVVAPGSQKMDV